MFKPASCSCASGNGNYSLRRAHVHLYAFRIEMKRSFLVIWAVASTTLLLLFLLHFILDSSLFAHRGTDYYYPDDLKRMALPSWTLTKPPPVAVERAVAIAREHVETKYQERAQW